MNKLIKFKLFQTLLMYTFKPLYFGNNLKAESDSFTVITITYGVKGITKECLK